MDENTNQTDALTPAVKRGYHVDDFKPKTSESTSKYDPNGVLQENIALRQLLARKIMGDASLSEDPDSLKLAMQAMSANDSVTISMARIKVDEESNAAKADMAKEIAMAALSISAPTPAHFVIENAVLPTFELPSPSRDFVEGETEIGTAQLSEKEIMSHLNQDAPEEKED